MGYNNNKKRKRRTEKEGGATSVIKSSLWGIAASFIAFIVLWIAVSFIAYSCNDPDAVLPILAFCALYLASMLGGFVASKIYGDGGIISAGICGVAFAFLLLFVSFAFMKAHSSGYSAIVAVLLRVLVALAALVGGFFGTRKRKRRRPRTR